MREMGVLAALFLGGNPSTGGGVEKGGAVLELESASDLLRSGLAARLRLREVCVAGYPEGHPLLGRDHVRTKQLLLNNLRLALRGGAREAVVVSQLCLDPEAVVRWLGETREGLRDEGLLETTTIRVGVVGPTPLG